MGQYLCTVAEDRLIRSWTPARGPKLLDSRSWTRGLEPRLVHVSSNALSSKLADQLVGSSSWTRALGPKLVDPRVVALTQCPGTFA